MKDPHLYVPKRHWCWAGVALLGQLRGARTWGVSGAAVADGLAVRRDGMCLGRHRHAVEETVTVAPEPGLV